MAEQQNDELVLEEGGGKSKKLLIIIIAAVLGLVIIGAVAFFMLSGGNDEVVAEQQTASVAQAPSPAQGTAIYVTMPRPFTFNVPGTTRDRLVQIKVQLMVRGDNNHELAKKHIPLIEGTLLKAFSTTNADDLATVAGKDALKLKAAKDVQIALEGVTGAKIVEEVLFVGFVMQ